MSLYTKIKAILFIWNQSRLDKKPFNKKMKGWLSWHIPFEPLQGEYCPNCGDGSIKNNGNGFFRCRNPKCEKSFIILENTDR